MNILIFTPGYPYTKKSDYSFVKQLVDEWVRQGHNCTVIATFSITYNRSFCKFKTVLQRDTGGKLTILRPNVLSFSNFKIFGLSLTNIFHDAGIKFALRFLEENQDIVYCHFWQSGHDGYFYAKHHNSPMIIATGESDIKKLLGDTDLSFLDSVKGIVCVSKKNKDESIQLGLTIADKCDVFPNSINPAIFHKINKVKCRMQIGVPNDVFIIAFVGAYKENKGADRLSEAIKLISGKPVYSFFIGAGSIGPYAPNMLHNGRLMHEEIPVYLNAADVFVLPTLAEGCCNAIIEAMACGLPIISSNLPFNWDVLNAENSIMIDPMNIQQIADAIVELRDNPDRREKMSKAALATAESLTIEKRAKNIISFMQKQM